MYWFFDKLARVFAWLGGLVLSALIIMTCVSIAGRSLNSILHGDLVRSLLPGVADALLAAGVGPVNGDFELVEAGMAFAIFAFLPLCQLSGAHASVDIFTGMLPVRIQRVMRMIVELVFAAVLVLIAWQLLNGMQSKRNSGQTTLLLQYPVWWGYAAALSGAIVAALVAVYVGLMRAGEALGGHDLLPADGESAH